MSDHSRVNMPMQACFWVGGLNAPFGWSPFLCVDLHYANGDLYRPNGDESYTETLPGADLAFARRRAEAYAARYGVAPDRVFYDDDSTVCFADC